METCPKCGREDPFIGGAAEVCGGCGMDKDAARLVAEARDDATLERVIVDTASRPSPESLAVVNAAEAVIAGRRSGLTADLRNLAVALADFRRVHPVPLDEIGPDGIRRSTGRTDPPKGERGDRCACPEHGDDANEGSGPAVTHVAGFNVLTSHVIPPDTVLLAPNLEAARAFIGPSNVSTPPSSTAIPARLPPDSSRTSPTCPGISPIRRPGRATDPTARVATVATRIPGALPAPVPDDTPASPRRALTPRVRRLPAKAGMVATRFHKIASPRILAALTTSPPTTALNVQSRPPRERSSRA